MSIGWSEILLILVIVLLLFGSKRIPELARSLGRASREFKKAKDEFTDELEREGDAVKPDKETADTPKK